MIKLDNASHWYFPDGTPCHEVPYADKKREGQMRPTTKADAVKLGLSPSVTNIMRVLAKPGLEVWKQNQVLMSALTHPQRNELPAEEFALIVAAESAFEAEKARQRGTVIHQVIADFIYQGDFFGRYEEDWLGIGDFDEFWMVQAKEGRGVDSQGLIEHNLIPSSCGYGGKIDFISNRNKRIYDFKTTELKKKDDVAFYPEHVEQLVAYRHGLGADYAKHDLVSVVIPVDAPDKIAMKVWSEEESAGGLEVFQAAYKIWKIRNRFK